MLRIFHIIPPNDQHDTIFSIHETNEPNTCIVQMFENKVRVTKEQMEELETLLRYTTYSDNLAWVAPPNPVVPTLPPTSG